MNHQNFQPDLSVAGLSPRGGINQIHVVRNQNGKSCFGIFSRVSPQQIQIARVVHPLNNVRRRKKVPENLFELAAREIRQ